MLVAQNRLSCASRRKTAGDAQTTSGEPAAKQEQGRGGDSVASPDPALVGGASAPPVVPPVVPPAKWDDELCGCRLCTVLCQLTPEELHVARSSFYLIRALLVVLDDHGVQVVYRDVAPALLTALSWPYSTWNKQCKLVMAAPLAVLTGLPPSTPEYILFGGNTRRILKRALARGTRASSVALFGSWLSGVKGALYPVDDAFIARGVADHLNAMNRDIPDLLPPKEDSPHAYPEPHALLRASVRLVVKEVWGGLAHRRSPPRRPPTVACSASFGASRRGGGQLSELQERQFPDLGSPATLQERRFDELLETLRCPEKNLQYYDGELRVPFPLESHELYSLYFSLDRDDPRRQEIYTCVRYHVSTRLQSVVDIGLRSMYEENRAPRMTAPFVSGDVRSMAQVVQPLSRAPAPRTYSRVCALPEPNKVRIVTPGFAETLYAASPYQRVLWDLMHVHPSLVLTGPHDLPSEVARLYRSRLRWLSSVDYSAATDGIPMGLTKSVAAQIRDLLSGVPDVDLAEFDRACADLQTTLVYETRQLPKGFRPAAPARLGRETLVLHNRVSRCYVVPQGAGQLMASKLSFPILCAINLATVVATRADGRLGGSPALGDDELFDTLVRLHADEPLFGADRELVNGDDLLVTFDTLADVRLQHAYAHMAGFTLSVGKSYVDERMGQINSTNFLPDDGQPSPRRGARPVHRTPVAAILGVGGVKYEKSGGMDADTGGVTSEITGPVEASWRILREARDPARMLARMITFRREHLDVLSRPPGSREDERLNLFVHPRLGGLGLALPPGFDFYVTDFQKRLAAHLCKRYRRPALVPPDDATRHFSVGSSGPPAEVWMRIQVAGQPYKGVSREYDLWRLPDAEFKPSDPRRGLSRAPPELWDEPELRGGFARTRRFLRKQKREDYSYPNFELLHNPDVHTYIWGTDPRRVLGTRVAGVSVDVVKLSQSLPRRPSLPPPASRPTRSEPFVYLRAHSRADPSCSSRRGTAVPPARPAATAGGSLEPELAPPALLRQTVVNPGWVASLDDLIGDVDD